MHLKTCIYTHILLLTFITLKTETDLQATCRQGRRAEFRSLPVSLHGFQLRFGHVWKVLSELYVCVCVCVFWELSQSVSHGRRNQRPQRQNVCWYLRAQPLAKCTHLFRPDPVCPARRVLAWLHHKGSVSHSQYIHISQKTLQTHNVWHNIMLILWKYSLTLHNNNNDDDDHHQIFICLKIPLKILTRALTELLILGLISFILFLISFANVMPHELEVHASLPTLPFELGCEACSCASSCSILSMFEAPWSMYLNSLNGTDNRIKTNINNSEQTKLTIITTTKSPSTNSFSSSMSTFWSSSLASCTSFWPPTCLPPRSAMLDGSSYSRERCTQVRFFLSLQPSECFHPTSNNFLWIFCDIFCDLVLCSLQAQDNKVATDQKVGVSASNSQQSGVCCYSRVS